jgi:hypothetical protein
MARARHDTMPGRRSRVQSRLVKQTSHAIGLRQPVESVLLMLASWPQARAKAIAVVAAVVFQRLAMGQGSARAGGGSGGKVLSCGGQVAAAATEREYAL